MDGKCANKSHDLFISYIPYSQIAACVVDIGTDATFMAVATTESAQLAASAPR